jgi:hypothetical protein
VRVGIEDFPQKPIVRQLNPCHFKGLLFIATETPENYPTETPENYPIVVEKMENS